ncbi:uncharacterized protein METZ01_LOCUS253716, partial [marine metagenome]
PTRRCTSDTPHRTVGGIYTDRCHVLDRSFAQLRWRPLARLLRRPRSRHQWAL